MPKLGVFMWQAACSMLAECALQGKCLTRDMLELQPLGVCQYQPGAARQSGHSSSYPAAESGPASYLHVRVDLPNSTHLSARKSLFMFSANVISALFSEAPLAGTCRQGIVYTNVCGLVCYSRHSAHAMLCAHLACSY